MPPSDSSDCVAGAISYEPLVRDMTWSYSRLKTFDDCPYRWYLKYIRYPGIKGKDMFFSDYGTFVHELLASYYTGEKSASQIQTEYLVRFRDAVRAKAPSQTVFKNYFTDGLNHFKQLRPPDAEVLSVENKINFCVNGASFVGYIDLVEKSDSGALLVLDHKSRALKPRSNRAKATRSDLELDEYLKQLYLYSVYIKEHYGKFPDRLCFNCFRSGLVIDEPFDPSAYALALAWAAEKIEEIARETAFRPDIAYFKCAYLCEMQDLCPYYALSRG